MHDLKLFTQEAEKTNTELKRRGLSPELQIEVSQLDKKRKKLIGEVEETKAQINTCSKEIGALRKSGSDDTELRAKVATLKESIANKQVELEKVQADIQDMLSRIPNFVDADTPIGKDESDNKEIHRWGEPAKINFEPKDHVELGEKLGGLDFDKASQLTGARFAILKGGLARLERAIANFMIDFHLEKGREEVNPPFIVNDKALYGTTQLPKFEADLFKIEGQDWYLIPTAEVPITNLQAGEIIEEADFLFRYVAYTPCFRSEAGSHGRDTRGLIRMHQFHKVEMVDISHPDKSNEAHESMKRSAEEVLEALKLPYRTVQLCTGDIGFAARRTYDLEVWVPSQNKYREISSVSNCGDFQARRASIRFRGRDGKLDFAHTLNGSGLAVGRTLVAIMENYQQEDGSIKVPEVLVGYMGGITEISAK